MGHGTPTIQEALDHGFRPSLSSDHGVTIAQDFFSVMRTTFTLQHMQHFQRVRAGDQKPPALLTCRDMLEFATTLGWDHIRTRDGYRFTHPSGATACMHLTMSDIAAWRNLRCQLLRPVREMSRS